MNLTAKKNILLMIFRWLICRAKKLINSIWLPPAVLALTDTPQASAGIPWYPAGFRGWTISGCSLLFVDQRGVFLGDSLPPTASTTLEPSKNPLLQSKQPTWTPSWSNSNVATSIQRPGVKWPWANKKLWAKNAQSPSHFIYCLTMAASKQIWHTSFL